MGAPFTFEEDMQLLELAPHFRRADGRMDWAKIQKKRFPKRNREDLRCRYRHLLMMDKRKQATRARLGITTESSAASTTTSTASTATAVAPAAPAGAPLSAAQGQPVGVALDHPGAASHGRNSATREAKASMPPPVAALLATMKSVEAAWERKLVEMKAKVDRLERQVAELRQKPSNALPLVPPAPGAPAGVLSSEMLQAETQHLALVVHQNQYTISMLTRERNEFVELSRKLMSEKAYMHEQLMNVQIENQQIARKQLHQDACNAALNAPPMAILDAIAVVENAQIQLLMAYGIPINGTDQSFETCFRLLQRFYLAFFGQSVEYASFAANCEGLIVLLRRFHWILRAPDAQAQYAVIASLCHAVHSRLQLLLQKENVGQVLEKHTISQALHGLSSGESAENESGNDGGSTSEITSVAEATLLMPTEPSAREGRTDATNSA